MPRPMSDQPADFALAIATEIRKELGDRRMSGRALARTLGRSEKYVRDRLTDKYEFSLNDVEAFAHFIAVTPEDFIARIDDRPVIYYTELSADPMRPYTDDELALFRSQQRTSPPAPTVGDEDPITSHALDEGVKSAFDLAAQEGERRADQPHTD